jgi:hypothetical protein
VVIFKLPGVHGFLLKKLAAVTSALGLRGMGCEATEPSVKRKTSEFGSGFSSRWLLLHQQKFPLISHKAVAN